MSFPEFSTIKQIKATRKNRVCQHCGQSIPVGSSAIYNAQKYQGEFIALHYHPECWRAVGNFWESGYSYSYDDGPTMGEFRRGSYIPIEYERDLNASQKAELEEYIKHNTQGVPT
jgi:hypothetical protein